MVDSDIKAGIVKPLLTTVFDAKDVEQAFRYMASGKHIGKVLLKVRQNPSDVESLPISVKPRVYCDGMYKVGAGADAGSESLLPVPKP